MLMDHELILRKVGYFLKHASRQISAVEELQVDVQMWWHEALFLFHLVLSTSISLLRMATEALGKTLFEFRALSNFVQ